MLDVLKTLAKQPYWTVALVLGSGLVALPCLTVDKGFQVHPPTTYWPIGVGLCLLLLSGLAFGYTLVLKRAEVVSGASGGLDLTAVKERNGVLWTTIDGCEIRCVYGRVEDQVSEPGTGVVLACNEYFDDRCVGDTSTALGAYVNRVFDGQATEFVSLVAQECRKKLGTGTEQQKTDDERALSFGAGRCLLLSKPLGRSVPLALVSTTTQRAGYGLAARISYLFDGMREVVAKLADFRINEIVMPVLGGGKGGIDAPLALVGLLLALAEAARYGQGGQRLKRVTVVVFKRDEQAPPAVDPVVVRRALALIGSRG
ncbi:MAG: hypothetical protein ACLPTF_23080 [Steroidobacteraceae bacterium]